MKKFRIAVIILVLVAGGIGLGMYFKDDFIRLYESSSKGFSDLQKINIGDLVAEVRREVLTPSPLRIGGVESKVVLLQSKTISETNLQREQNGLSALKENQKLDEAAAAKANDMFKNQYFEHVSPSGVGPAQLQQNYGYSYILAGENLILGNFSSEKEMVQAWMDSPGHRANILNNRYAEIGVAVIKGTYEGKAAWIGVQEFGLPSSACDQANEELKNQISSSKAQMDIMAAQIEELKSQIDGIKPNSPAYRKMVDDYNELVRNYNTLVESVKNLVAQYNDQVNAYNNCVAGK